MNEEVIALALKKIEEMLRDPTCVVSSERGILRRPNYDTGYMEAEPTGGMSITITVRGGGGIRDESPDESAWRLIRDLRRDMYR